MTGADLAASTTDLLLTLEKLSPIIRLEHSSPSQVDGGLYIFSRVWNQHPSPAKCGHCFTQWWIFLLIYQSLRRRMYRMSSKAVTYKTSDALFVMHDVRWLSIYHMWISIPFTLLRGASGTIHFKSLVWLLHIEKKKTHRFIILHFTA